MVGDFQWQENLKTLCEYVASKIWFNRCSALPNSLVAIVKKHRNYGRYFSFKKKRVIRKIAKSVCKYLKLNFNYINLEIERYSDRFTGYIRKLFVAIFDISPSGCNRSRINALFCLS